MIPEVGRVDDGEDGVGARFAGLLTQHDGARHRLVGGARGQAVAAGQVDQLNAAAVGQDQASRLALDGNAGIVADLLA